MPLIPSHANVGAMVAQFDHDDATLEAALRELVRAYPQNTTKHHVFLKVTALNALYATRIPVYDPRKVDVSDMTEYIWSNGEAIDQKLAEGQPEVVDQIANPEIPDKASYHPFSFATKYASWHRPECYPIWDSRVRAYLLWLQKEREFAKDFRVDGSWKYSAFRETISLLKEEYDLNGFSFKDLDKFLYLAGGALLKAEESK